MKNWIPFVLGSFLAMNAAADASFCGYKDYFHLSDQAHPEIHIMGGYSEQDVFLEILGPRSFVIRDAYQCRAGYAHVTVAFDNLNWCNLDIKDGPYMNHPTVRASCSGLQYNGIQYDGINTYSYTISLG